MFNAPITVRMKDLKPGDLFYHQGGRWKVLEVNGKVLVKSLRPLKPGIIGFKKEFPLAQAKVELIEQ